MELIFLSKMSVSSLSHYIAQKVCHPEHSILAPGCNTVDQSNSKLSGPATLFADVISNSEGTMVQQNSYLEQSRVPEVRHKQQAAGIRKTG